MFSLHDIHVPRVPHARFRGKTGMGARGDVIAQMDWSVGEILAALDRLKLADDTLVIFTSDNGPVVDDGYKDDAVAKLGTHTPAGPFRGGKYSNFEGGTRVPWLLRWPARVKPAVSDALISQVDLFASLAALTGQPRRRPTRRPTRRTSCPRCSESRRRGAPTSCCKRARCRCARGTGSTSPRARARASTRTRTRSSATIRNRSSTTCAPILVNAPTWPRRIPRRRGRLPRASTLILAR